MTAPDPISSALGQVLEQHAPIADGAVADYIPELALASPDDFGMSVVSVHGRAYEAGDAGTPFTIQSVSKPFVYALAVTEIGFDAVARHVGFEPSGEPFNAISLDPVSGLPANPLINAGAIVTASLVPGVTPTERFERIARCLSAFAGRQLEVDERIFRSERDTGDRNRALAYLARSTGVLTGEADEAVEIYFRQCSLIVTATDLAVMAATLANSGVNPRTGEEVIDERVAIHTLSLMSTCGMYDHSGEWMVHVGLPAKSGVGGGIAAVQPGEFGIGVYSPPLDAQGNSVRGVATLKTLSQDYGLHVFAHQKVRRSAIAASTTEGHVHTVVLRGEIDFATAEEIVSELAALPATLALAGAHVSTVELDVTGVTLIRPAAQRLLASAADDLIAAGLSACIVDPGGVGRADLTGTSGQALPR